MNAVSFQVNSKPFFRSKIVLIALAALAAFLSIFLSSSGITDTQMEILRTVYPDIAKLLQEYKTNANLFGLIGGLSYVVIAVMRIWFTTTIVPQSIPSL